MMMMMMMMTMMMMMMMIIIIITNTIIVGPNFIGLSAFHPLNLLDHTLRPWDKPSYDVT